MFNSCFRCIDTTFFSYIVEIQGVLQETVMPPFLTPCTRKIQSVIHAKFQILQIYISVAGTYRYNPGSEFLHHWQEIQAKPNLNLCFSIFSCLWCGLLHVPLPHGAPVTVCLLEKSGPITVQGRGKTTVKESVPVDVGLPVDQGRAGGVRVPELLPLSNRR